MEKIGNEKLESRSLDTESIETLKKIAEYEQILSNRVGGVKSVYVVLSAKGMVFDIEALRQKIVLAYPESQVFFGTPLGKSIGKEPSQKVDLLIDFTGPGQRQSCCYSRKLRRM